MEISFHDTISIKAESSFGEKTSWLELEVTERNSVTGRITKCVLVFYTRDKDAILCAKIAQAINQSFAEARETPDEVA